MYDEHEVGEGVEVVAEKEDSEGGAELSEGI